MLRAVLALTALSLSAQEPRFDVRSRLVVMPVNVFDGGGRPVEDLEAGDFQVLDNARAQKVTVDSIATGVAPIALVVAVESAGVSAAVLEKVQKAAGMIQPLITGDRGCGALVSFSERVTWLQECTKDSDAFERAFDRLRPADEKRARMLDAVSGAIERLRAKPDWRRVILLISESRDRGSETEAATVALAAQSAGVTVYAITYSAFLTGFTSKVQVLTDGPREPFRVVANPMQTGNGNPASKFNPKIPPVEQRVDLLAGLAELARLRQLDTVQALTSATGGTSFGFRRQKGLEDAIEQLSEDLHSQYVVTFAPDAPTPGYHKLELKVARKGEFRVRTKPGYWIADEAPAEDAKP